MATPLTPTEAWLQTGGSTFQTRSKHIKKLGKTEDILGPTIKGKLELHQELSEFERAYVERPLPRPHKDYILSKTNHGHFTANQTAELDGASQKSPCMMMRAYTLTGTKHTNGFTTSNLYIPRAYFMKNLIRTSMTDIPLQRLRPMLGTHLLWLDRVEDTFLSWTVSYVFATVHLYLRHLKGQGIGCLSVVNRTRASHPEKWHVEQVEVQESQESQVRSPAKFYAATDLCDYTRVYDDHEWKPKAEKPGLHPRKLTHEYLTHGVVEYPEHDRLQQATWGDLVAAGIFELVPELKVGSDSRAAGLYTVLRYIRTTNYEVIQKTTDRELEIAQEIAWLHTRLRPGEETDHSRPNLWVLLYALTFHKRAAGDELLQKLIYGLGYTRQDLDENLYADFGVFPSNLPEMQSLYYLATDVQTVVGGQLLNTLVLTSTYSRYPLPAEFQRDDAYFDDRCNPRLVEPSNIGYERERKCGLPCDCSIWTKSKKREWPEEDEKDKGGEEHEEDEEIEAIEEANESQPDALVIHVEDERQIRDSPYAEELNTSLLTYKSVSMTTY